MSNKLILNTVILYSKMVITLVITLYSTRLVIKALGSSDLGIFFVVAGVISMLSFLNVAMSFSTQRFLSYSIGKNEKHNLREIFNSSITLHLLIGIIVLVLVELMGVALFRHFLNIPPDRMQAAWWVYHFAAFSCFVTIITVPFDAIINAYENMVMVAVISILESLGKLSIALYITGYQNDRLILYGGLLAGLTLLLAIAKRAYCSIKYPEAKEQFHISSNKEVLIKLFSFAGWNLYGTMCGVFRSQGITVVLNNLFGSVVNAAYGIANQVNGQLSYFASAILMVFNPQIMKSEGSGDRSRMLQLSKLTSKYSFYMLSLFSIPLIIEMNYVLEVWLETVPAYTANFCQLLLSLTLVNQLTVGLQSSALAVGRIKIYQLVIGSINLAVPILGYVALKFGQLDAYVILVIAILVELLAGLWRIILVKRLSGLNVREYIMEVIVPALSVFTVAFAFTWLMSNYLAVQSFPKFVATTLISTLLLVLLIFFTGISRIEKEKFKQSFSRSRK